MYCVTEAIRQADLAHLLKDIHLWFDHNKCNSLCLSIKEETFDIVIIEASFNKLALAEAFVKAFEGWGLFPAMISEAV